jgi:hypothetical protein
MEGNWNLGVLNHEKNASKLYRPSTIPHDPGNFYIFYIPDIWFGKKLVNYCKLHM